MVATEKPRGYEGKELLCVVLDKVTAGTQNLGYQVLGRFGAGVGEEVKRSYCGFMVCQLGTCLGKCSKL